MANPKLDTVDLTNCDREPIHLLGEIQPFGFLIALTLSDWKIACVSANIETWLGQKPDVLIGKAVGEVIRGPALHTIRSELQLALLGNLTARIFNLEIAAGLFCDVAIHIIDERVVIECEPTSSAAEAQTEMSVHAMMNRLMQHTDENMLFRAATREIQALTGFDRVMLYRFDHDGSGEVVAEAARSGLETYLGLHYPASDIPRQARRLYEQNLLRIIPDIHAPPVPLIQGPDADGGPIDLSMSVLRSVSRIHIEYLGNMGVGASMSISVLHHGKLWGLFACHHYGKHYVDFHCRTTAELFGQLFALLRANREHESDSDFEARSTYEQHELVRIMANEAKSLDGLVDHLDGFSALIGSDGIGLWVNERGHLRGKTPTPEQFEALIADLAESDIAGVTGYHDIGAAFPGGELFVNEAAGMLVVPLSRPGRDYLLFFREEVIRQVNWAGDPTKPIVAGPLGDRLTPRKSFELWRESVRGQSAPWRTIERRAAENLRVILLEVILRLADQTATERKRAQERQDLLIAELNHRIRNIFGLIRGIVTQSRKSTDNVDTFAEIVSERIRALARAHDRINAVNWGPSSFRALILAEAGAYLGEKADRLVLTGEDALVKVDALPTVALVFHEMITNSAKYGALSDSGGTVVVEAHLDASGDYRISWSEQGGPAVKPPTRRGFGSTVIERAILHDLKGEVSLDFAPEGLSASFLVPAPNIFGRVDRIIPNEAAEPVLLGRSIDLPSDVLLVEDNMIIAMDVEETLRMIGVKDVRVAGGSTQALQLIDKAAPSFALLDVNLAGETSFAIAERLMALDVPFAFASGYAENAAFPQHLADVPRIHKPYSDDALRRLFTERR